jgi:hypothetical protein
MADPISLAAMVSGGASAAGAAVGAIGSLKQGAAQSNMYNYQAGVAKANAVIAQQDAVYATQAGEVEGQQSGMRTRAEVGQTRAAYGAGNISGGSPSRVEASEVKIGQQNEGIIASNAAKRAYGFNVKAAEDTATAQIDYSAAKTSTEAGTLGAVSSIIGGVGQVASKWMQAGQSFGSGGGDQGADMSQYVSNYVG